MTSSLRDWLASLELEHLTQVFEESQVDLRDLPLLSEDDLKELGLALGPRRRLLNAIVDLPPSDSTPGADKLSPAEPPPAAAERRQLTVMFCDLVGSTPLSQRVDPEDLRGLMRRYQDAVAGVIAAHGGHVANYVGDGVIAYFGWPQADEDQAAQAVRAGMGAAAAVQEIEEPDGTPLASRVGIATGRVVVGDLVGETTRQADAISGETPNLAARLQEIAKPGTVVIEQTTRQLIGETFQVADLGRHDLKGVAEAIQAWRVSGERELESRFDAAHSRALIGLVGRKHELGLLLDRWRMATEGEGQIVVLSGEPGIGKSRLCQALHDALGDGGHVRVRYQCSPYHANSALFPTIQQLQHAAGFARDDPDSVKLDKLEAVLAGGRDDPAAEAPLIAKLLSLDGTERYGALDLTPQQIKQRTLEVLISQLLHLAARQPVLFLFEDAHWTDPTSLELLEQAAPRIRQSRVLMLVTHRPDWSSPFGRHANVTSLLLNRLGRRDAMEIVRTLVGSYLPEDRIEPIVARTDGVPLFLEELTKSMVETGLDVASDEIPATLQASLLARLDRLGTAAKEIAQVGAVIGREFRHDLVCAVADKSEIDMAAALGRLVESELAFRTGMPPDATYTFKHALVQDVAYDSLLRETRQAYHCRTAEALIEILPETPSHNPDILARHFVAGADLDQAVGYLVAACEKASGQAASREAIEYGEQVRPLLTQIGDQQHRATLDLKVLLALAPSYMTLEGPASARAGEICNEAGLLAEQVGTAEQQFAATWGIWHHRQTTGEFDAATEAAAQLMRQAEQSSDPGLELQAHHSAWTTSFGIEDLSTVIQHAEEGRALYDEKQHGNHAYIYGGHDPGVCCRMFGSLSHWMMGYPDRAIALSAESLALGERLDHQFSNLIALSFANTLDVLLRRAEAVAERSDKLLAMAREHGIAYVIPYTSINRGWARAIGDHDEGAVDEINEGLEALRESHQKLSFALSLMAEVCWTFGLVEVGLAAIEEAKADIAAKNEHVWEPEIHRHEGLLHLVGATPDTDAAEAAFGRAIDIARNNSARSFELRATTEAARLYRNQGRAAEAHDLLAPIYGGFSEGFDTHDLKAAKALLDELSQ
jgi:class 3 adenylate cyclase/predicted ATPase